MVSLSVLTSPLILLPRSPLVVLTSHLCKQILFFFFAFFIINIFFEREREGASEREAERERGEGEKQGSPRGSCFTPSGVRPEVGLELTQLGAQAYPMWDLN